jgi:hypothetical protein
MALAKWVVGDGQPLADLYRDRPAQIFLVINGRGGAYARRRARVSLMFLQCESLLMARLGNVGCWQESPLIGAERKTSAWSEDYRV